MHVSHITLVLVLAALAHISAAMPVQEDYLSSQDPKGATLERRIIPPLYKGDANRHQLAGAFGAIISLTGAFSGITGFMIREDTQQRQRKADLDTLRQQQQLLQGLSQPGGYRGNFVKRWWGGPSSSKVLWIFDDYVKPAGQVISLVAGTGWLATSIRDNIASRKKTTPSTSNSPMQQRQTTYNDPATHTIRSNFL